MTQTNSAIQSDKVDESIEIGNKNYQKVSISQEKVNMMFFYFFFLLL